MLLMTTAHMPGGDVSVIVPACGSGLLLQQRGDRLAFVQIAIDNAHDATLSRGSWF
jgi:hypothetical protein